MGRDKKRKPRVVSARTRPWDEDTDSAEGNPDIWIRAMRRLDGDDDPHTTCLLTWGALEWYAPAPDVMQTATDLHACAAYADMLVALLDLGMDGGAAQQLLGNAMSKAAEGRRLVEGGMLGAATTLGCMPAASSKAAAGVVMLKRGSMTGAVSTEGAREMAAHWMQSGLAANYDEIAETALRDLLGAGSGKQCDGFFEYMAALRELDMRDAAVFRAEESARLRMLMGLPLAPEPTGE
ncbi:hypothetical protein [Streptomyces yaizuensis]|uniref:Uncharacterized protein n=1 Tax=Streptomyces yaizuensis TaxID=2989713 RepID=A0AA86MBI5_9ACTN|nr:hypothetical protein [Streptomyces sp. YSPA8]BDT39563.1 hypothetical protein SYYSPA8_37225 [Streptomyces sp. YSPA8]